MIGPVLALAAKDLRLLVRNRGALFFAFGWPVLMALFFGLVFGGGGGGDIPVAVVDEDGTPGSAALVERLRATEGLEVSLAPREEAERLVRAGRRSAAVIVPRGYGAADERLFHGEPRRLELALDPSRKAEGAMLEGLLTAAAMESLQEVFSDRTRATRSVERALAELEAAPDDGDRTATRRFLGELRTFVDRSPVQAQEAGAGGAAQSGWKPLEVARRELTADRRRPTNAFEVTFPQGALWGVIGCSLTFALSLVVERTRGTLTRLRIAPISRAQILAGKGLACLAAIVLVLVLLFALGRVAFGVVPGSWLLLAAAGLSVAVCFVGIMMVIAALGRNEQSAGGLGWAIMMPLTMFGGGMIPLFAMPGWMRTVGHLSPVKWGILALEGALWRGFGAAELALPCAILVAVGVLGFALGARALPAEG